MLSSSPPLTLGSGRVRTCGGSPAPPSPAQEGTRQHRTAQDSTPPHCAARHHSSRVSTKRTRTKTKTNAVGPFDATRKGHPSFFPRRWENFQTVPNPVCLSVLFLTCVVATLQKTDAKIPSIPIVRRLPLSPSPDPIANPTKPARSRPVG